MKLREKRLPPWLAGRIPPPGRRRVVQRTLAAGGLETVCENARCPNLGECYGRGTATFMILGNTCTRACAFCAVGKGRPAAPDPREPEAVARAVDEMDLDYAVVTSVTRDDLADGGAAQFAATVCAIRDRMPACRVEVLTPDFGGSDEAIRRVAEANPDVYNHNVETVPRLYGRVRPGAAFDQSVGLLARVKQLNGAIATKSGLMVGLGETRDELAAVLARLREAGCDAITIGQYLRPAGDCLPVTRYLPPDEFDDLGALSRKMGFTHVASGPLVRSSYRAEELTDCGVVVRRHGYS